MPLTERQQEMLAVSQLLFRQAGHRVGGQTALRERVHIGVIGLVGHVEPERPGGILFRPVQHAVLEYMGKSGLIDGVGQEGKIEDPVGIVIGDPEQFRAGFLVLKVYQLGTVDWEVPDFHDFKTFNYVADGGNSGFV